MNNIKVANKKIQIGFKGIAMHPNENVLSQEYATLCENFVIDDGVLKGNIGIDFAKGYFVSNNQRHTYDAFPSGKRVKKVFLYRRTADGRKDDRLMAHLADGSVWWTSIYKQDVWHQVAHLYLVGDIETANYNFKGDDIILLVSSKDALCVVNDDVALACSAAPHFSSITVHNERVFGGVNGEQTQVWFSNDFDPSNWNVSSTEAGFINFADGMGEVLKVVSFLNYLYIFRDYGIYRLTAYGDQSDFILKKVFTDTGRIYKNSIVLAGDKILFYADSGLFVFDGYNLTRFSNEVPEIFSKNTMCAAYLDDCYYLACRLKSEGAINNALIAYNTRKKTFCVLHECAIRSLETINVHDGADVICAIDGNTDFNKLGMISTSGKVLDTPTKKRYVSPYNNLFLNKRKVIRDISFVSKYPISICLTLDKVQFVFDVKGKKETQKIIVEKSGVDFGIEIESECENALVTPLIVNMDIV